MGGNAVVNALLPGDAYVGGTGMISGAVKQMLSDVDDAITSSQSLTETLAEVAPLEQQIQRLGQSSGGG